MGKSIKKPIKYYGLGVPVDLIDHIKEHIKDNPKYRSVSAFAHQAIINQLNYEQEYIKSCNDR